MTWVTPTKYAWSVTYSLVDGRLLHSETYDVELGAFVQWPGLNMMVDATLELGGQSKCDACYECLKDQTVDGLPRTVLQMILCPKCGNKRCPKATHHVLACTGSNEPGQAGSRYP